jgi:uncharacterized protein (DUF1810 family)
MTDEDRDAYRLERFIAAQAQGGTYEAALAELRGGRKRSHWMWFVFPQLAGLGRSPMARAYAIGSLAEARAYLAHPLLGPRLRACASVLIGLPGAEAEDVFGSIDAIKLRSSMTLFAAAAPDDPRFNQMLEKFFGGMPDEATLRLLGG